MKNVEITCDSLSRTFSGRTVFKNLSFKLSSSQSLSVTGKNGSGKSTLVKIIANLIHASSGKISISENGIKIPQAERFEKIGFVSPYMNLYDELTGFENLDFFYKLKLDREEYSEEEVRSVLQKVNLYEKRNELLKNYSSGMRQRLKLAFAVLNKPEVLIMDEPRTNLDKSGIELVYQISKEQIETGILIIATNDEEDKTLCSETLNIEDYK